ncbi:MAG: hypothetical protein HY722_15000, partial [Planctomycetes bacterium]|nr:hypothetical protein [Planctomycetota bacterium]
MRWTAWSPGLALVLAGVGAAGAEGLTLEAVAVDYSSALAAQHGESGHEPPPLAGVEVGLRVESAVGQPPRSIAARTDAGGRVRVELGEVPPGTRVRLEVRA